MPVQLSADGKSIVSYPGPSDVKAGGHYLSPVKLHKGYLLDRIGVGRNTAFVKYCYYRYSRLKSVSPDKLLHKIDRKARISEMYDCGVRGTYTVQQLNDMIDKGELAKKCKMIQLK